MTKGTVCHQPDVFRFVSGVSYSARTSQETIKQLASLTARNLGELNRRLAEVVAEGEAFLTMLVENGTQFTVDECEEVASNLLDSEEELSEVLSSFCDKEEAAVCDPDLYGQNEEVVTEAYKRAISLIASLVAVTQSIRWAVLERVEDFGEPEGEAVPIEDFLASLG